MRGYDELKHYHGRAGDVAADGYRANGRHLQGLTAAEIRNGIAEMPKEKLDEMIDRVFPGDPVSAGSVGEALGNAGALFTVAKAPMFFPSTDGQRAIESTRRVSLVRTDTDAEIGDAQPTYGIVQTTDAFAGAQALVDAGSMTLDKIQVVDGGSRIRIQGLVGAHVIAQMGRPEAEGPDVLANFVTFQADHSGAGSNTAGLFTVRLHCFNGLTTKTFAAGYRIRHTKNAEERVHAANAALLQVREASIREAAMLQRLAQVEMTGEMFRSFATSVVDEIRGNLEDEASEQKRRSRARAIEELEELFRRGQGCYGTSLYDGYMSVTEWVTARKEAAASARSFAKRFESSAYGTGADYKTAAMKRLERLVKR